jgi:hypothetical protein
MTDDLRSDGIGASAGADGGRGLPLPRLPGPDEHVLRGEPSADDAPGPGETSRRTDGGEPAGSDGGGERSVLHRSVTLRFPDLTEFSGGLRGAEIISALMDHITATAIMRGELAELRLDAQTSLHADRKRWRKLHVGRKFRTVTELEAFKAEVHPALADRIADAEWTIARCTEEMKRMDADYEAASREYTLIAGGG